MRWLVPVSDYDSGRNAERSANPDTNARSRGAIRPSFAFRLPPSEIRGRRESRMRAAPAVSCAICTRNCAHEHTGSAENIRPSLRNGFTTYIVVVLVRRALLPPSPLRNLFLTNLTPAFGRRNHTPSPYAQLAFVFRKPRVHRISTRVRDDSRSAPLIG
jgi:hypothetical protein